jgi:hypothetical protein
MHLSSGSAPCCAIRMISDHCSSGPVCFSVLALLFAYQHVTGHHQISILHAMLTFTPCYKHNDCICTWNGAYIRHHGNKYLDEGPATMNSQILAQTLTLLATVTSGLQDEEGEEQLISAVIRGSESMNAQDVASTVRALAKMDVGVDHA